MNQARVRFATAVATIGIISLTAVSAPRASAEDDPAGAPQPTEQPAEQPTAQATPQASEQPVDSAAPTPEPTTEPTTEPSVEPSTQPTNEPGSEPSTEPTIKPSTGPDEEPSTESSPAPTTESNNETNAQEPTTEATPEATTEPTTEPTTESTAGPTTAESPAATPEPPASAPGSARGAKAFADVAAEDLTLVKTDHVIDANQDAYPNSGDSILYTFTVTNTGTVAVGNLKIDDPMLTGLGITITCNTTDLGAGESTECTANGNYAITLADEAEGKVLNTATASGVRSDGGDATSPAASVSTGLYGPLYVSKYVYSVNGTSANVGQVYEGDEVIWGIYITNMSQATYTNVDISDPLLAANGLGMSCDDGNWPNPAPVSLPTTLTMYGSASCITEPYTVTAADVAAGSLTNTAIVSGCGEVDPTDCRSRKDSVTIGALPPSTVGLKMDKQLGNVTDVNSNGIRDAGDSVDWNFELTNTGSIKLTAFQISDPFLESEEVDITCPANVILEPGKSMTCSSDAYTITTADIAAGEVRNTASARAMCSVTGGGGNNRQTTGRLLADPAPRPRDLCFDDAYSPIPVVSNDDTVVIDFKKPSEPTPSPTPSDPTTTPSTSPTTGPVVATLLPNTTTSTPTETPTNRPTESPAVVPTALPSRISRPQEPTRSASRTTAQGLPSAGGPAVGIAIVGGMIAAGGGLLLFGNRRRGYKHRS